RVAYNEERSQTMVEATSSDARTASHSVSGASAAETRYLIPPATSFVSSVEEDARLAQLASPAWTEREVILRPLLQKIYRDPDAALVSLNALASDIGVAPRRLADDLAVAPGRLGRMRGSE
ncbi:hypothetical protein HER21_37465, partial [Pseudomonas sp. BGM005]|nr:hypothetical protein [Pseudomonas sp. BG5]